MDEFPFMAREEVGANFTRAFTLVEVLVGVAITALLCALLLGSFSRTKASAQQSACVSNLKQIHAAMMTYAAENNGYLPSYCEVVTGKPNYYWVSKLRQYLGQSSAGNYWDNEPAPSKLFRCPSDSRVQSTFQQSTGSGNAALYGATGLCGLNGLWFGVYPYDDGRRKSWTQAYPLASVDLPSKTALLFDHDQIFTSGPTQLSSSTFAFRHGGRINVAYFDGHIGSLSQDGIPKSSSPFWGGNGPGE